MATKESVIIGQFKATKQQDEWLKNKSATTGDSQASILRGLLQKEVDKDEASATMQLVGVARADYEAGRTFSPDELKNILANRKAGLIQEKIDNAK